MSDEQQRLFVGVPLPDELLPVAHRAQAALPAIPGLRLLRPEQWHVTLAFIGEVGMEKATTAEKVVAELPAGLGGRGSLRGYLMLPSARKARVVALAVEDRDGAFARVFTAVMDGLEEAGVMRREKRPFRPHVTVARLRVPGRVVPKSEGEEAPYPLQSVCLYRSELKREGASYSVLCRRMLEVPA